MKVRQARTSGHSKSLGLNEGETAVSQQSGQTRPGLTHFNTHTYTSTQKQGPAKVAFLVKKVNFLLKMTTAQKYELFHSLNFYLKQPIHHPTPSPYFHDHIFFVHMTIAYYRVIS